MKLETMETESVVVSGEGAACIPHIEVPEVTWYKHAGLRRLYLMMPILMLCATINGYDGSLLNGLQTMDPWRDCEYQNWA